jgi:hypothetical protein
MKTHGHAGKNRSPEYNVWLHMRERVNNPNHVRYSEYGGKGIAIDPRWQWFENFLADMGERPAGMTLDRVDSNGPYSPANCRWADSSTQNRNKRQTAHCGGRDGSPRCGYFAGHSGFCQTPPDNYDPGHENCDFLTGYA